MKKLIPFGFVILGPIAMLIACQKDEAVAMITGQPVTCGHDGARIHATIGGADWCASTSVIAISSGASLSATGIALPSGTLTFGADSMYMGMQNITMGGNSALFVDLSGNYTVASGDPGHLIISQLDPAAHHVKGTISVRLHLNGTGAAKQVDADFDLNYTVQ
jgi:hypothetical protein